MLSLIDKGRRGEEALNTWLRANGLSYLYIAQSPDTFASLFPGAIKRPDFLVLFDSVGLLAVDAKNYALSGGVYTLGLEKEVRLAVTFERVFRIPMWYAFLGDEEATTWFWISALRAVEVGEVRVRRSDGEEFLAIRQEHFAEIATNEDLGKLYTQRSPHLSGIRSFQGTP